MRLLEKLLLSVAFCLLAPHAMAEPGKFFTGVEVGTNQLNINSDFSFTGVKQDADLAGFGAHFGYMAPSRFLIEGRFSFGFDDFLFGTFDSYSTEQFQALVGYSIPLSEKFSLAPKIGVSKWELTAEEGMFLNPGPEMLTKVDGTDAVIRLDAVLQMSRVFSMYLSYSGFNGDFGDFRTTRLGFQWHF